MFCPSFKRGLNLIENAVVVKLSKIMAFKICPQRQFCEFLQNSSEFVLASVLGNPNSNLISPAEFQISVDFPTKYNFLKFQGRYEACTNWTLKCFCVWGGGFWAVSQ